METRTSFNILNNTGLEMEIIHEPECFEFSLPLNEEVTIEVNSCKDSILLRTSIENGKVIIAVLGSESLYTVYYKGEDIFAKFL
jgi:hypothetical protein